MTCFDRMQEAWSKVLSCIVLQSAHFVLDFSTLQEQARHLLALSCSQRTLSSTLAHFKSKQGTCLQRLAGAVIVL